MRKFTQLISTKQVEKKNSETQPREEIEIIYYTLTGHSHYMLRTFWSTETLI
jgi:hypothetical protein